MQENFYFVKKASSKFTPFNKSKYAVLILCIISIFSCASKKEILKDDAALDPNPKLIFLNYALSEGSNELYNIQFVSKKITDGRLKSNSAKYTKSGAVGDLLCMQLDKNDTPITKQIIKNPLLKTIEYINDSLKFESKQIKTKKSTVTLRLQLRNNCKSIVINQIIDSLQNTSPLIITKIN